MCCGVFSFDASFCTLLVSYAYSFCDWSKHMQKCFSLWSNYYYYYYYYYYSTVFNTRCLNNFIHRWIVALLHWMTIIDRSVIAVKDSYLSADFGRNVWIGHWNQLPARPKRWFVCMQRYVCVCLYARAIMHYDSSVWCYFCASFWTGTTRGRLWFVHFRLLRE
jgi:hypothetical protein